MCAKTLFIFSDNIVFKFQQKIVDAKAMLWFVSYKTFSFSKNKSF